MKKNIQEKGSTLIELIIYLAISSVFVTVVVAFLYSVILEQTRFQQHQLVDHTLMVLDLRLASIIRASSAIDVPNSTFDEDFALNSNALVSLINLVPAESPTQIKVTNGALMIKLGTGSFENIISDRVLVSSLVFVNRSSVIDSKHVSYDLTITSQPSPVFYVPSYSRTISRTYEFRN